MASRQKVDVIALCQKDLRVTKAVKDFMARCDSTLEGTDLAKYAAPKYPMVLRAASALIVDSENQRISAAQNLGLAAYAVFVSDVWKEPLDGRTYKSYTSFIKDVFADHDGDNLINYAAAYHHFGRTALYGKYSLGALKELVSLVNSDKYGYKDKGEIVATMVDKMEQEAGRKLTYKELRAFADRAKGKIRATGKVIEESNTATATAKDEKESARPDKGETTTHDFQKMDSDRKKAIQEAENRSKIEKDKINAWYQGIGERFIRACSAIDGGQKDVVISIQGKMYVVSAYKPPKESKPGGTARKRNSKVKQQAQQESTQHESTQQESTQQESTQQESTQQESTQQAQQNA